MKDTNPKCKDCGHAHDIGAEAIFCDVIAGKLSPGLDAKAQATIARRWAEANPVRAALITER